MNVKVIVGLLIVVVCSSVVPVVLLFRTPGETTGETLRARCSVQNVTVSGSLLYGRYVNVVNVTYSIVYQKVYLIFSMYNGGDEELVIKRIILDNKYEPRDFQPTTVRPKTSFKTRYLILETSAYDSGLEFIFYKGSTHNVTVVLNVCGEEHVIQTTVTSV